MKKITITLLAIFGWCLNTVSAADLYVRDLGAGGAYATVSDAITAASNGDRIIIRPKSGGIPYVENLVVAKNLTFVSEINFSKYIIQGNIQITPLAGRIVTFHNLSATGNVGTTVASPTGGRTFVNIFNSLIAGSATFDNTNVSVTISGSTFGSTLSLVHGIVTGNDISSGFIYVNSDATTDLATAPVYIIANKARGISLSSTTYAFNVLNNFFYTASSSPVSVSSIKPGSVNLIQNNTIAISSAVTNNVINFTASIAQTGFVSVLNNVLNSSGAAYKIYNPSSTTVTVYAYYNISSSSMANLFGVTSANNSGNANITVSTTNGNTTGENVNGGSPEEEYQDINLTRNDIGNTGGSNAWTNYWSTTTPNKAQVYFLNTPRRIYTGGTNFTVEGGAFTK
ncbi:MAG: hypothetical protein QM710_07725 [Flavobacterium sp.]